MYLLLSKLCDYGIRKTLLSSLFEIENQEQVENDTESQVLIQQSEEENITCYCGNVKCVIEMKVYRYIGQRQ